MTLVLAHGCFDLLHLGHIRHLKEAKSFGNKLTVSLTEDQYVQKRRGRLPHFSTAQRREALLALGCVDNVHINRSETAVTAIEEVKPDVYVKGVDYADADDPFLRQEIDAIERIGGTFKLTTSEKWSSSKLLHAIRLPDEALRYLDNCRERGFLTQILDAFGKADEKAILFVGDDIIDEYRYVKPLSRPSKELVLATVADWTETFHGGIAAAAKHGGWKRSACLGGTHNAITKTRFVDSATHRKLFEIYSQREVPFQGFIESTLSEAIRAADVVVVVDYGHGAISLDNRRHLEKESKFLAVTAQSNAGNWRSNLITRYKWADYFCLDEQELKLAGVEHLNSRWSTITKGANGSTSYKDFACYDAPALVAGAVDTIGAGDSFLAVTAPLLAAGLDIEKVALVGNLAGGLKTLIVGQRSHVTRDDLVRNLQWLLG